jgi:hypothetical protein
MTLSRSRLAETLARRSIHREVKPRRSTRLPVLDYLERRLRLAAGALDPTFGTAGVRTVDWSLPDSLVNGMTIEPDIKILVVGASCVGAGGRFNGDPRSDFFLTRLHDDGTADTD